MAAFKNLKELTEQFKKICETIQSLAFSVYGGDLIGTKELDDVLDQVSQPYERIEQVEGIVFGLYKQLADDLGIKMPKSTEGFSVDNDYVLSAELEKKLEEAQKFLEEQKN